MKLFVLLSRFWNNASFFIRGVPPGVAIPPMLQASEKKSHFFALKIQLQNCLADLRALLANQGPLDWMFAWACHRHCERQDSTLTLRAECVSFQSGKMWAAALCWSSFPFSQALLESISVNAQWIIYICLLPAELQKFLMRFVPPCPTLCLDGLCLPCFCVTAEAWAEIGAAEASTRGRIWEFSVNIPCLPRQQIED